MLNVINSSIITNFKTVQELSRTLENTQRQQNVFQGSRKDITGYDSEFRESPWRSRTSDNLSVM